MNNNNQLLSLDASIRYVHGWLDRNGELLDEDDVQQVWADFLQKMQEGAPVKRVRLAMWLSNRKKTLQKRQKEQSGIQEKLRPQVCSVCGPDPYSWAVWTERKTAINAALETLTPREEEVLRLRYGRDLSLKEVGSLFGVSRERIRQIEAKALRKLRHPSRSQKLREFI